MNTANTAHPEGEIRIVLVGTQHPGNIGSAARAIKTMGLRRLVLVAPERYPHADAVAMAAGADDVLDSAGIVGSLAEAVSDCALVIGCTARSRRIQLEELSPRAGAARLLDAQAGGAEVALVFGRERTGLDNDELQLCHAAVHIPANPDYSSLNLAAAVQVLAYELRVATLQRGAPSAGVAGGHGDGSGEGGGDGRARRDPLASHAQLEGFFGQLGDTLDAIDFHKGRAPQSALRKLRRIFLRCGMDEREVRLLRGVLADAQRMARLARGTGGGEP
ncbi:RNA methyltransferase [Luteimonas sp. MJ246]|uniref:RNA methyltransferase n=1 Tax=Luteimonas sp. MJ174 TaxID=3129237 RepID=UPI0031BA90DF